MVKKVFILAMFLCYTYFLNAVTTSSDISIKSWLTQLKNDQQINTQYNNDNPEVDNCITYYSQAAEFITSTIKDGIIVDMIPLGKLPSVINESQEFKNQLNTENKNYNLTTLIPVLRPSSRIIGAKILPSNKPSIESNRNQFLTGKPDITIKEGDVPFYSHILLENNGRISFPTSNRVSIKIKPGIADMPSGHCLMQLWWLSNENNHKNLCTFETGIIKSKYFTPPNSTNSIFIFTTNDGYSDESVSQYNLIPNSQFVQTSKDFIYGFPIDENKVYELKYEYDQKTGRVYHYVKTSDPSKTSEHSDFEQIGFYKAKYASTFFSYHNQMLQVGGEINVGNAGIYSLSGTIYSCEAESIPLYPETFLATTSFKNPTYQWAFIKNVNNTPQLDIFYNQLYNPEIEINEIKFINNSGIEFNLSMVPDNAYLSLVLNPYIHQDNFVNIYNSTLNTLPCTFYLTSYIYNNTDIPSFPRNVLISGVDNSGKINFRVVVSILSKGNVLAYALPSNSVTANHMEPSSDSEIIATSSNNDVKLHLDFTKYGALNITINKN